MYLPPPRLAPSPVHCTLLGTLYDHVCKPVSMQFWGRGGQKHSRMPLKGLTFPQQLLCTVGRFSIYITYFSMVKGESGGKIYKKVYKLLTILYLTFAKTYPGVRLSMNKSTLKVSIEGRLLGFFNELTNESTVLPGFSRNLGSWSFNFDFELRHWRHEFESWRHARYFLDSK